jgi:hypothetical protein
MNVGVSIRGDSPNWPTTRVWRPAAVASLLGELGEIKLDGGAWHEDFLTLGARLRVAYGNAVMLDESVPAYFVACGRDVLVSVTCQVDQEHPDTVLVAAPAGSLYQPAPQIFERLLALNGELSLTRLSLHQHDLWAEGEVPFVAAHAPALTRVVTAVAGTVRDLEEWRQEAQP